MKVTEKEVKELREKTGLPIEAAELIPVGPSLSGKMNPKEIDQYIKSILGGEVRLPSELERVSLEKYNRATQTGQQTEQRIAELQAELEALKVQFHRNVGHREAYLNLLVGAEELRRKGAGKLEVVKEEKAAE